MNLYLQKLDYDIAFPIQELFNNYCQYFLDYNAPICNPPVDNSYDCDEIFIYLSNIHDDLSDLTLLDFFARQCFLLSHRNSTKYIYSPMIGNLERLVYIHDMSIDDPLDCSIVDIYCPDWDNSMIELDCSVAYWNTATPVTLRQIRDTCSTPTPAPTNTFTHSHKLLPTNSFSLPTSTINPTTTPTIIPTDSIIPIIPISPTSSTNPTQYTSFMPLIIHSESNTFTILLILSIVLFITLLIMSVIIIRKKLKLKQTLMNINEYQNVVMNIEM